MDKFQVSSYNIYIDLPENKALLIHGYTGNYFETTLKLSQFLKSLEKKISSENFESQLIARNLCSSEQCADIIKKLKRGGFLTLKEKEEEHTFCFNMVDNLCDSLYKELVHYHLILTYQCNFNCSYCYIKKIDNNSRKIRNDIVSKKMIDNIFDNMENVERKYYKDISQNIFRGFTMHGGEPLMKKNKDLVKYIINKAKKYPKKFIAAVTNGYDLDYYQDLLSKDKISKLQITLDGISEVNNVRRVSLNGKNDSFEKIAQNISIALDKGIYVRLRINLDKRNIKKIDQFAHEIINRGWNKCKNFYIWAAPVAIDPSLKESKYCLTTGQINEKLTVLENKNNEIFESKISQNKLYRKLFILFSEKKLLMRAYQNVFCGALSNLFTFDLFGNIYSCTEKVGIEKSKIGSFKDNKLNIIDKELIKWRNRKISKINNCKNCSYKLFCGGGCAAKAEAYSGSLYAEYCDGFKEYFHLSAKKAYLNSKLTNKNNDN